MYSSTFIFATKQFDDDFHRLDQAIAQMAREIPGYIGRRNLGEPGHGPGFKRVLLGIA
jgi:hypothetical protein